MLSAWSLQEVEATVADYLSMLDMELRGEPYNKAAHNRALQQFLENRSHGAIERKHQNISAILIELGYPYIEGYKPLRNYQDLLRLVVEERLVGAKRLSDTVEKSVESPAGSIPDVPDILAIQVDPLHVEDDSVRVREIPPPSNYSVQRNYLEIEARNRSLGRAGEEFIVLFERERLAKAKHRNLAKEIRHVALSEGDSLG